jgi:hypothetical protein
MVVLRPARPDEIETIRGLERLAAVLRVFMVLGV